MIYEFYVLISLLCFFRLLNLCGCRLLLAYPKWLTHYQVGSSLLLLFNLWLFLQGGSPTDDPYHLFLSLRLGANYILSFRFTELNNYMLVLFIILCTPMEIFVVNYLRHVDTAEHTASRVLTSYAGLQLLILCGYLLILSADFLTTVSILPCLPILLFIWYNRLSLNLCHHKYHNSQNYLQIPISFLLTLAVAMVVLRLEQLNVTILRYPLQGAFVLANQAQYHYFNLLILLLVLMLLLPLERLHRRQSDTEAYDLLILLSNISFWILPILFILLKALFFIEHLGFLNKFYQLGCMVLLALHLLYKLGRLGFNLQLNTQSLRLLLQIQLDFLLYLLLFGIQYHQYLGFLLIINFSGMALLIWLCYGNLIMATLTKVLDAPLYAVFKRRYSFMLLVLLIIAMSGIPVFLNGMTMWVMFAQLFPQRLSMLIIYGIQLILLILFLYKNCLSGFYHSIKQDIFCLRQDNTREGIWRHYANLVPVGLLIICLLWTVNQYGMKLVDLQ